MENKTFNILFDTVSAKLPFSYGILAGSETNDPNKAKMKKRNLKNALKTYVWGSYKPLDFDEWRAAHGYSREWCTGNGIYINGLYSGVSHKKKYPKISSQKPMSNTKRISTGSIRNAMRKLQISKHLIVLPTFWQKMSASKNEIMN
jgi:hypothetical protein